jgi:hypothetical protein
MMERKTAKQMTKIEFDRKSLEFIRALDTKLPNEQMK